MGLNSCNPSTHFQQLPEMLSLGTSLRGFDRRNFDHQLFPLRQEFMQRRIECSDRDRQPVHRLEEAVKILALEGQELARAALRSAAAFSVSAMIICCTYGSRSFAKNMCSVRHSPMPSAPNPPLSGHHGEYRHWREHPLPGLSPLHELRRPARGVGLDQVRLPQDDATRGPSSEI